MKKIYRHGDLLLCEIGKRPKAKVKKTNVLLEGEVTGHAHRLDGKTGTDFKVYENEDGTMYLQVLNPTPLKHEEHSTIEVPVGDYEVIRQVEYDPYEKAAREVQD